MTRFREGEEHIFRVVKEVVESDNNLHFMLSGPGGRKFLLPAEPYAHYGITVGEKIKCRIDRINCIGKIFLEPENPHYREGKSYLFEVAAIETRADNSGTDVPVFIVTDFFGNRINVISGPEIPEPGTKVKLRIRRISKGRLLLAPYKLKRETLALRSGRYYEFLIERIAKGIDNDDYFVIIDPEGKTHTLSVRHYKYYGFEPGMKFRGKVVRNKISGEKIIEPVNPFYKTGLVLALELTAIDRNIINDTFTLELIDKFGHAHCIETAVMPEDKTILCRVVAIRKGKPILELL